MDAFFLKNYILYQDDLIIIINKPSGLAVNSTKGGGENLEKYLDELRFELPDKPTSCHRLDKDTSGCLILGRNKESLSKIGKLFMKKRIIKTYLAVVHGNFDVLEGRIDIPLKKKSPHKHHWHMEAHPEGLPSITDYKVIKQRNNLSLVQFNPITGRTHQIRVHSKTISHPILGDKIYGVDKDIPLHLHAHSVIIPLYHNQKPLEVTAPLPGHFEEL